MKKATLLALLALALCFAAPSKGGAATYLLYEAFGGTWYDANKSPTNTEDDLMCWAATAANILAWGGWTTPVYQTADQIFRHFQDHWTDNGGYMSWAWKWWFDGSPPPYRTASYPDVPGGGNFFPNLNFYDYYASAFGKTIMSSIDTLLHQGKGVGLIISKNGAPAHAVTVWGFSYSAPGVYNSIFITDSDDNFLGLKEYPLIFSGTAWYLGGGYQGWKLGTVQALSYSPYFLASQNDFPKQLAGMAASPVPLPPAWLLVGTGLGSLFLWRRRRAAKGT